MPDRALEGLTAVELCGEVAGAYAGKLLADLGARVVLIEPAGGHPLRQRPPIVARTGESALFHYLSAGKESVVPADDADARRLLAGLLDTADFLFRDDTAPFQALLPSPGPAQLITIDLTAFGRDGPYHDWRGSDIATWAMGGYMYFTGEASRAPLVVPGAQSQLQAGVDSVVAALAALHERRGSGWGQTVEVCAVEAVLSAHNWLTVSWEGSGTFLPRLTHDLVRCVDGWVHFMWLIPNPNILLLIGRPEEMDAPYTLDPRAWAERVPQLTAWASDWARDKTRAEIAQAAQELRVPLAPVMTAADLAADPQMAARGWWEPGDPASGVERFPGQPYKFSATPPRRGGRAPRAGEHTAAVRAALPAPATPPSRSAAPAPQGGGPLAGLRVVEVTNNWAGPLAGRNFGDLGAEVIKVEWAAKPATRGGYWPGPTQDMQRQYYNRALYFNEMNRNKRDLCLDLSAPAGKEVLLDLLRDTDILIENNSARVMGNLGLDYAALRARNPRLIMVSIAGFGASGPCRDWVAYGSNIEASSGLAATIGYDASQYYRTSLYYADPVAGQHGTLAALAALESRRRTGDGQWIDISLNEAGAVFCHYSLLHYLVTGALYVPNGNRDPRFAPQGAYRCIGNDNWLVVSVQADGEWPRLCAVIGRPDLAADPSLATRAGRWDRHEEIDAAIGAWTATVEQYEAVWALQRAGVSAAPVLANWQMLADPHLFRRGFYQPIEHPAVGVYHFPTWPWRLSRTPARITRPAPLFGEHNRVILRELGFSAERIAGLYAAGICADAPVLP